MPFIHSDKRSQLKTSTYCNGHRTYVPPNIPPCLNESHSSQELFDYEIFFKHIFYKSFLIDHLTKNSTYQQATHQITMLFIHN